MASGDLVNRRTPLFAAIGMALLALIVLFVVVLPKVSSVSHRKEDLRQEQARQATLEAELARLQQAQAELPEIRRQLARFTRKVPPSADLPGLIRLLQVASDASALDFMSVAPSTPQVSLSGDASIIPASIVIIGGYFPVQSFLHRLETLPRSAKVIDLALVAGPDGLPQLQASMTIEVFSTDVTVGPGAPVTGAPVTGTPSPAPSSTSSPSSSPSPSPSPSG